MKNINNIQYDNYENDNYSASKVYIQGNINDKIDSLDSLEIDS